MHTISNQNKRQCVRLAVAKTKKKKKLFPILLELPVPVIKRTDLTGFQPAGNTMKVESVITDAPGDGTLLTDGTGLVRLTLDAEVHDVVTADGTVLDDDIPRP